MKVIPGGDQGVRRAFLSDERDVATCGCERRPDQRFGTAIHGAYEIAVTLHIPGEGASVGILRTDEVRRLACGRFDLPKEQQIRRRGNAVSGSLRWVCSH